MGLGGGETAGPLALSSSVWLSGTDIEGVTVEKWWPKQCLGIHLSLFHTHHMVIHKRVMLWNEGWCYTSLGSDRNAREGISHVLERFRHCSEVPQLPLQLIWLDPRFSLLSGKSITSWNISKERWVEGMLNWVPWNLAKCILPGWTHLVMDNPYGTVHFQIDSSGRVHGWFSSLMLTASLLILVACG